MILSAADKVILKLLLDDLSDKYSYAGCNDIVWPRDWTREQKEEYSAEVLATGRPWCDCDDEDEESPSDLFPSRPVLQIDSDLLYHLYYKLGLNNL